MKKIILTAIASSALSLIASSAFAFETGSYECFNGQLSDANVKRVATFQLSHATLKTDAGEVTLPYIDYNFDDQNGNRSHIKGLGQIAGDTWSNTSEFETVQLGNDNIRIVFGKNKVQMIAGECRKVK